MGELIALSLLHHWNIGKIVFVNTPITAILNFLIILNKIK